LENTPVALRDRQGIAIVRDLESTIASQLVREDVNIFGEESFTVVGNPAAYFASDEARRDVGLVAAQGGRYLVRILMHKEVEECLVGVSVAEVYHVLETMWERRFEARAHVRIYLLTEVREATWRVSVRDYSGTSVGSFGAAGVAEAAALTRHGVVLGELHVHTIYREVGYSSALMPTMTERAMEMWSRAHAAGGDCALQEVIWGSSSSSSGLEQSGNVVAGCTGVEGDDKTLIADVEAVRSMNGVVIIEVRVHIILA
jgi:predicted N-acetyltransferase YhbS